MGSIWRIWLMVFLCWQIGTPGFAAPVTMRLHEAPVREVLASLAAVGGVNMLVDDCVTGTITLEWKDVSWETALQILTRTRGLTSCRVGDVVLVSTAERLAKGFGEFHSFPLQFAEPKEVVPMLEVLFPSEGGAKDEKSGGGKSGRCHVDGAANRIVFFGSEEEAARVASLLKELDVPAGQVTLEAQVWAVNKNKTRDLGIEWKWTPTPLAGPGEKLSSTGGRELPGYIRYGGVGYEWQFQAKLYALAGNGGAEILAKPRITTMDGREARILIGDRIPVLLEKTDERGRTTTTVDYIDTGIKLTYCPRIHREEGLITAMLRTEVSSPSLVPEMKAYRVTTREAETRIRVKNGETMVIGGLMGKEESAGKTKIPLLGDLPLVGGMFRAVHSMKQETEIIIFLTARIVQ